MSNYPTNVVVVWLYLYCATVMSASVQLPPQLSFNCNLEVMKCYLEFPIIDTKNSCAKESSSKIPQNMPVATLSPPVETTPKVSLPWKQALRDDPANFQGEEPSYVVMERERGSAYGATPKSHEKISLVGSQERSTKKFRENRQQFYDRRVVPLLRKNRLTDSGRQGKLFYGLENYLKFYHPDFVAKYHQTTTSRPTTRKHLPKSRTFAPPTKKFFSTVTGVLIPPRIEERMERRKNEGMPKIEREEASATTTRSKKKKAKKTLQIAVKKNVVRDQMLNELSGKNYTMFRSRRIWQSCDEAWRAGFRGYSGLYKLKPSVDTMPFAAPCLMDRWDGGWTLIQRRMNGETDFYRPMAEYVRGFGRMIGELWLGLEKIRAITSVNQDTELLFVMEPFEGDGPVKEARYKRFFIHGPGQKYRLHLSGFVNGSAGDSLLPVHNGMKFTTFDEDNDASPASNCAQIFKGGWWYQACHTANPNGRYLKGRHSSYADGINWQTYLGSHYSYRHFLMAVKPSLPENASKIDGKTM